MTYRPQQHDLVLYNGWICRVPFPVDDEDTTLHLHRISSGCLAANVHISRLTPYSGPVPERDPEPIPVGPRRPIEKTLPNVVV